MRYADPSVPLPLEVRERLRGRPLYREEARAAQPPTPPPDPAEEEDDDLAGLDPDDAAMIRMYRRELSACSWVAPLWERWQGERDRERLYAVFAWKEAWRYWRPPGWPAHSYRRVLFSWARYEGAKLEPRLARVEEMPLEEALALIREVVAGCLPPRLTWEELEARLNGMGWDHHAQRPIPLPPEAGMRRTHA